MLQSSVIKNSKPCTEVGSVTEENLFLPASHRLTQFTSLSTFFLFLTKKGSLFKWMFKQVWTVRYSEVKWYSSVVSDSLGLHGPIQSMEFSRPEYWSELAFPFSSRSSQPRDCLLHCRQILYQLSHKGSPRILDWVAYSFSRRSSQPRNETRVSYFAGGFFTNWAIREAQWDTESI